MREEPDFARESALEIEWRRDVRERLANIEKALNEGSLQARVRALENNQNRVIGMLVAIQAVGGLAIMFLNWLFHNK